MSRWRRDPEGWRAFVSYSRREPEGLLRYMHWVSAADLTPRDEEADHPAWASSAGPSRPSVASSGPRYKPWYGARDAVGLPTLRWHDLRHLAGTTAAQSGATLAELQARLGHSTVAAALRYQHAASGRDAAIAEAMSNPHTVRGFAFQDSGDPSFSGWISA